MDQGGATSALINFAPIIIIGAIFYILIFLPMRKRQKKLEAMIAALKNNDKVITTSGIYGTIVGVKERTFILKIAEQVKIEVSKTAIAQPQGPEEGQVS
jgi:preprotein translocase subunit YajC